MANVPGASLFVKDTESRYIRSNTLHLQTYHMSMEAELIGKRARDFFPLLLAEAYEAEDRRVLQDAQPVNNEIWLVPQVRGTPRWFISSKSPLFDRQENVIGLVGLMHPIHTTETQRTFFGELHRVIAYIDMNYLDEITAADLAKVAGLSVPHFNRRFRQLLRLSPMEYILSRRVQEAQRLLSTTGHSVGRIATETGFYDQSHFTKRFSRVVGITPLQYRKRYRN
ncbi:MAG: helix-turn-helix domain-containing protein [Limisphaerales bacterium]